MCEHDVCVWVVQVYAAPTEQRASISIGSLKFRAVWVVLVYADPTEQLSCISISYLKFSSILIVCWLWCVGEGWYIPTQLNNLLFLFFFFQMFLGVALY